MLIPNSPKANNIFPILQHLQIKSKPNQPAIMLPSINLDINNLQFQLTPFNNSLETINKVISNRSTKNK